MTHQDGQAGEKWSRLKKCPVCERDSWCTAAPDGSAVRCKRVQSDKPSHGNDGAAWIHVLVEKLQNLPPPSKSKPNGVDWGGRQRELRAALTTDLRDELAGLLDVDAMALDELGLGWDTERETWTFPMHTGDGAVCGITWRSRTGEKKHYSGSSVGLYRRVGAPDDGLVVIVEGASDAAAMLSFGTVDVLALPSASAVVKFLVPYVRDRDVVVIGDNDDGAGARSVKAVVEAVKGVAKSLRTVFPPENIKDARSWRSSGATWEAIERAAVPAGPQRRRGRSFRAVATDPPIPFLLERFLPASGLGVLAGAPGAGKTLVALDIALRSAHAKAGLGGIGLRTGSTIYFAGEGSLAARVRAWCAHHSNERLVDGHDIMIYDGVPDLGQGGKTEAREIISRFTRDNGAAPALVVIDTLAAAAPGGDENDVAVVTMVIEALTAIAREFNCCVLVLHHLRKPQAGAPASGLYSVRGSTALVGAADAVLLAVADGEGQALRCEKLRDAETPQPLRYSIRGVPTGITLEDGKSEFGPIVEATVTPEDANQENIDRAEEDRVVDALRELGSATRVDTIVRKAKMKAAPGRAAVDRAISAGRIRVAGAYRRSTYQVSDVPENAPGGAPRPPTPPPCGTQDARRLRPGEVDVPDDEGRIRTFGTFEPKN